MNGLLLVDKPAGWTSHDVVAKLRGILRERRIGHAGTLDPMATGLLVVLVGRATRAASWAEAEEKTYAAALRLGLITDTQDSTGRVLSEQPVTATEADVEAALAKFRGEILQVPPMYSAIKIGGEKLYEIARRGEERPREPRPITIHALELTGRAGADFLLEIRCSKGTYVRTLCHDIGTALGCGGVMSALRRTASGDFSVEEAYSLEEIAAAPEPEALLLPVDSLFRRYPALHADAAGAARARNGAPFPAKGPEGLCRVYDEAGNFLLLGRLERGRVYTVRNFFEVS